MDAEADALYGLEPGEFTAARDALAARLRAQGRRDEAAEVRTLRRPTAPAAALNRAVRGYPEALEELLAAGRNLTRAQERLVAGEGDRSVLREAAEHVREAISALAAIAVRDGALSQASGDRVRATLQAALVDEGVREQLAAGRLQREAEAGAVGFPSAVAGAAPARRAPRRVEPKTPAKAPAGGGPGAAERLKAASRAVREIERRLETAVRRAERTAATVEDLRTRLAAAEAEAQAAEGEAGTLRSQLRTAKSEEAAAAGDLE